jgi:hypothetical protein
MRNHWISFITLLALILAGCEGSQTNGQNENLIPSAQETVSAPLTDSQITPTEQPAVSPPSTSTTSDVQLPDIKNASSAPREIIEKAKADLVKQFGVNADQIRVVEARAVTWPDASLGCPQPDMVYAQVLSPGYWVLLEADGRQYPYHTDQGEQIILCLVNSSDTESPRPLIPVNPDEIQDGQPWVPVE